MYTFVFYKSPKKWKWKSLSPVRLFVTPWTAACQAPLSMEFSRQEHWSRLPVPSPGDLPNPEITQVLHTAGRLYHLSHLRQSIDPSRWGCSNRFLVIPPVSHLAQPSCMHTQIPRKEGDFIMTACSGFRWGWRQTQMGGAPADGHLAGAGPASLQPWGPLSLWHPGSHCLYSTCGTHGLTF